MSMQEADVQNLVGNSIWQIAAMHKHDKNTCRSFFCSHIHFFVRATCYSL